MDSETRAPVIGTTTSSFVVSLRCELMWGARYKHTIASAAILDDCGRVAPRRRPDLLADTLADLAAAERATLGRRPPEHIARDFSAGASAERTTAAPCGLVPPPGS